MNSREIAELAQDGKYPLIRKEYAYLSRAHLALLDKLKNPSAEMITAGLVVSGCFSEEDERVMYLELKAANAVLLKEIEDV